MTESSKPSEPAFLPEQERSVSKELSHMVACPSQDEAEEDFLDAKDRLLNVSDWHKLTSPSLARFTLCDTRGNAVRRAAHIGDFIRIAIPGPGHAGNEEDGDDWVRIEALAYDDFPDEDRERVALQVRPAASPLAPDVIPQHFFSAEATSTFSVERCGKELVAGYWGRNETPNTQGNGLLDTVRNVAVAVGGILGLSDVQWKTLVRGLLEPADESNQ